MPALKPQAQPVAQTDSSSTDTSATSVETPDTPALDTRFSPLDHIPGQMKMAHNIDAEVHELDHHIATNIVLLKTTLPERLRQFSEPKAREEALSHKDARVAKYLRHLVSARESIDPNDLVLRYVDVTIALLHKKLDWLKKRHELFANHNSYVHERSEFTDNPVSKIMNTFYDLPSEDFFRLFRMTRPTFEHLAKYLQEHTDLQSGNEFLITAELKVAVFLYIVGHNATYHHVHELLQLSIGSIESSFRQVAQCLLKVAPTLITQPSENDNVFKVYETDARFSPYFKNCVGTFFTRVMASPKKQTKFLYAVDLKNRVFFVHMDGDLSKTSQQLYDESLTRGDNALELPRGKYFVAGRNMLCRNGVLSPYRAVTPERMEQLTSCAYETPQEIFNYFADAFRISQGVFDEVLGGRFHILRAGSIRQTVIDERELLVAIFALNNIIAGAEDLSMYELQELVNQEDGIKTWKIPDWEAAPEKDYSTEEEPLVLEPPPQDYEAADPPASLQNLRSRIAYDMWQASEESRASVSYQM